MNLAQGCEITLRKHGGMINDNHNLIHDRRNGYRRTCWFLLGEKLRMKVLIACEESQEVCKAFREKGHEAYSCDIQECSGGHPEWHINYSCLQIMWGGWNL